MRLTILSQVSENILKKVLEWCSQHKNDPAPTQDDDVDSRKKTTGIEEWDQKFMQVDQEMLFEIILAANHMDIKAILAVRCKTVANMIKGISRRDPQDEHPGPESWSNPGGSPLGATNYMDINVLPHVGCKTVANMIKGRRRRSVRRSTSKTTSLRRRKTRSTAKDYLAQHSATKSTTSMEGYENLL